MPTPPELPGAPVQAAPPPPSRPPPDDRLAASLRWSRRLVLLSFLGLTLLSVLWEFWLAPLRPGGSMLALKALPLALSLPALRADRLKVYQAWSMAILLYLCEGLVRATSDQGLSAQLAVIETLLSLMAFVGLLVYARARRLQAAG